MQCRISLELPYQTINHHAISHQNEDKVELVVAGVLLAALPAQGGGRLAYTSQICGMLLLVRYIFSGSLILSYLGSMVACKPCASYTCPVSVCPAVVSFLLPKPEYSEFGSSGFCIVSLNSEVYGQYNSVRAQSEVDCADIYSCGLIFVFQDYRPNSTASAHDR